MCERVFVYLPLCMGFCVLVCVLDWARVFVCECVNVRVGACLFSCVRFCVR